MGRDGGVFAYGDAPYLGNAVQVSAQATITSAMEWAGWRRYRHQCCAR